MLVLNSAEHCKGGNRVVGVTVSFLLCLLGSLAWAGLPQGFRAIYRDTTPFIWRSQSRAELADLVVTIPKFNTDTITIFNIQTACLLQTSQ